MFLIPKSNKEDIYDMYAILISSLTLFKEINK